MQACQLKFINKHYRLPREKEVCFWNEQTLVYNVKYVKIVKPITHLTSHVGSSSLVCEPYFLPQLGINFKSA